MTTPQNVTVGVGARQVRADAALIPAGWQVEGEEVRDVFLKEDGTLDPEYIVFTLREIPVTFAPTATPRPTAEPVDYDMYDMDAWCYPRQDSTEILSSVPCLLPF